MSEWIDMEKYSPKTRGEYLCFQPKQTVLGATMEARRTVLNWTGKKWTSSAITTHWMPLPDPPERTA